MAASEPPRLSRHHQRRLRAYYRSAGWPCHDAIEIDLLAAGLIEREAHDGAADTIRVTEAGITYYVMPAGLATLAEIPFDCGVIYSEGAQLVIARPAEHRPVVPGFGEWMAIARRGAERFDPPDPQLALE